jgi:hypothetical protein
LTAKIFSQVNIETHDEAIECHINQIMANIQKQNIHAITLTIRDQLTGSMQGVLASHLSHHMASAIICEQGVASLQEQASFAGIIITYKQ